MKEETFKSIFLITFVVVFIGAIINGGYCALNYWNTPWTETPWHCHSR